MLIVYFSRAKQRKLPLLHLFKMFIAQRENFLSCQRFVREAPCWLHKVAQCCWLLYYQRLLLPLLFYIVELSVFNRKPPSSAMPMVRRRAHFACWAPMLFSRSKQGTRSLGPSPLSLQSCWPARPLAWLGGLHALKTIERVVDWQVGRRGSSLANIKLCLCCHKNFCFFPTANKTLQLMFTVRERERESLCVQHKNTTTYLLLQTLTMSV